jgi:hypothetical protein
VSAAALRPLDVFATATLAAKGFVFTARIDGFSKLKPQFGALTLAKRRMAGAERGADPTNYRGSLDDPLTGAQGKVAHDHAGIAPDHAERALGHVTREMRGVQDCPSR